MKIWIDLDNTPHVPFFRPIIRELESRGHRVVVSARDAYQVCELADEMGVAYTMIGRHWGKNPLKKVLGLLWRSVQMLPFWLRERPDVALSHGSRSQVLLSKALRTPTIVCDDYEGSGNIPLGLPRWLIVPEALADTTFPRGLHRDHVRFYRGLKEDVYVPDFEPDPSILDDLDLDPREIIVSVRPPADEAHYRDSQSDVLFVEAMSRLTTTPGVRVVMLPRTGRQGRSFREAHPEWFADRRTVIPSHALNGLDLLWYSDLVLSGGGTMNREAAALGVPAFSVFAGAIGAVDRRLEREGRLTIIRTTDEVRTAIPLTARDKTGQPAHSPRPALTDILGHIEDILRLEHLAPE
jgi:uncharacterized protein